MLLTPSLCHKLSHVLGPPAPLERDVLYGRPLRDESLLKEVIEGRMIGKRLRGRKRMGMLNEFLKEASYVELKRKAENRKEWKHGSQESA